jgi:hypothetical protein
VGCCRYCIAVQLKDAREAGHNSIFELFQPRMKAEGAPVAVRGRKQPFLRRLYQVVELMGALLQR